MKKGLIGLLATVSLFSFAVVGNSDKVQADEITYYEKVTENLTDWSGEYLIGYTNGTSSYIMDGSLTSASNMKGSKYIIPVIVSENKIYDDYSSKTFIFEKVGNDYTIKSKSGNYIGTTEDKTNLTFITTNLNCTISNDNGNILIKHNTGTALRYNNLFNFYQSSSYSNYKAVNLFKKVVAEEKNTNVHNYESTSK